jgi:hypothetical protein
MACGKRNVVMGSGVIKVLSQSKVNEVYRFVDSNHEVIGLDITVYVVVNMKTFQGI